MNSCHSFLEVLLGYPADIFDHWIPLYTAKTHVWLSEKGVIVVLASRLNGKLGGTVMLRLHFLLVLSLQFMTSTAFAGDPAKGKATFSKFCVFCHGETGKGDGIAAEALNPHPRDLSNKSVMATLTDTYLSDVITKGGVGVGKSIAMPSWGGKMTPAEVGDLISYVRTLAK